MTAQAIPLVQAAGEIIVEHFRSASIVNRKGFADFATQVDYEVEAFLINKLREITPKAHFLAEETEGNSPSGPMWIIDPVDGTTNLLHQNPHLAISLAFYDCDRITVAVVYNPLSRELFVAEKDQGATLNGARISISPNIALRQCIVGIGLPYNRSYAHEMFTTVERVFTACQDIRRSGSASLDLAYVACARLDGYFELNLKPWDFAAGSLILTEAGGVLTRWDGGPVNVRETNHIAATNGQIHHELLSLLALPSKSG